jgi:hypothetical protein
MEQINRVNYREIKDLWELLEYAHCHHGDSLTHLLLQISMRSVLLEGILQGLEAQPANNRTAITLEPAELDLDRHIEQWQSSIEISRRYADPPLAFHCFEKALQTAQQKGLRIASIRK